jgi:hypothetical protein
MRPERGRRLWLGLGAGLLIGLAPLRAAAYCRESLLSQASGPCDEAPGVPFLFWTRPCFQYRFNAQAFTHLHGFLESDVRETFAEGFRAWTSVECDGKRPFYVEQAAGVTPTTQAELAIDRPNESVIFVRTAAEWASGADHDSRALALTWLWFDKVNGEILDVDMELNAGRAAFADCAYAHCTGDMVDLLNTVTHEAGHVFGLGHSAVARSTMDATTYDNAETDKRKLSPDDTAGFCALDLPEPSCAGSSCSCPAPAILRSSRSKPSVASCDSSAPLGAESSQRSPAFALAIFVWLLASISRWRRLGRGA